MQTSNLMKIIVSAIIGVVVFSMILIPVVGDATTLQDTYTNKGYYDMTYTEADSVTFVWEYTSPHQVTVNNEVVALEESPAFGRTVLCGDEWLIRYTGDSVTWYSNAGGAAGASVASETSVTIVAEDGEVTLTTSNSVTRTNTYTYLYVVDTEGEYVMKESGESVYLNSDSEIYAMGLTSTSIGEVYLKAGGNKDDGITATVFRYGGTIPITVDHVTANFTTYADHEDLYSLDNFIVTVTNGTNTADLTYSYFIVPAEVTADRAYAPDAPQIALINIIPMLVLVGLVLGVVGAVIARRD